MRIETKEAVSSIYHRVTKLRNGAEVARNEANDEIDRDNHRMLCGKVKAYTDVLCLIRERYKEDVEFPDNP